MPVSIIILHAIIGLISVKFNGSCKLMMLYVNQYTLSIDGTSLYFV